MAPAAPGSQQGPDGPDVTHGAPRQGGQLDIQCSRRFQVESSNSAISDTGCLVKISVCPRGATRREHPFRQRTAVTPPVSPPAEPRCPTQHQDVDVTRV
ncbi:hypothetical protein NDU88_004134 [Pleurodeles waltl]|uniref:Uncharacterized protein n=1 Tax=Pleurodeles waltl TaxID=8319 RepID=A0AAV7MUL7_PLEWA|nr:hypothetical protein NDU88_004134 [Pleurodeles waltl]